MKKIIHKHNTSTGTYLKNWVYGGIDGIITTFAVVSGVVGANLSSSIILILGFANLIADGISMAVGDYLSEKSKKDYYLVEKKNEEKFLKSDPKGEKTLLEKLYLNKGFNKKDSRTIVNIFAKNKNNLIKEILNEELDLNYERNKPVRGGIVTFLSFLFFGFIPLLLFVIASLFKITITNSFLWASLLSGAALFVLGVLKSRLTGKSWLNSGIQVLIVGGLAALAAYFVGELLASII